MHVLYLTVGFDENSAQVSELSLVATAPASFTTVTWLQAGAKTSQLATFDSYNRLNNQVTQDHANTTLSTAAFSYDDLGRLTEHSETQGGVTTTTGYSYDRFDRVSSITRNGQPSQSTTYLGNTWLRSATTNGPVTTTFGYGADDQPITSTVNGIRTDRVYHRGAPLWEQTNNQTYGIGLDIQGNVHGRVKSSDEGYDRGYLYDAYGQVIQERL